jgi:hypothetical protein
MGKKGASSNGNDSPKKEAPDAVVMQTPTVKSGGFALPLCFGFVLGVAACGGLLVGLQQLDPVQLSAVIDPGQLSALVAPFCPARSCESEVEAACDAKLQEARQKPARVKHDAPETKIVEKQPQKVEVVRPEWPGGDWPQCHINTVLARSAEAPVREDLVALFGSGVAGCRMDDCTASDTFKTARPEDCAHACSVLQQCSFWRHGAEECVLLASDAAQDDPKPGYVSAPKACVPPQTKFSPGQAVIAVLDSEQLKTCDSAVVSDSCPNLGDAARTWLYALETLKKIVAGVQIDPTTAGHLEQVSGDTKYLVDQADESQLQQMYETMALNNRMVVGAFRQIALDASGPDVVGTISRFDISLPSPVRGLICQNSCPAPP